CKNDINIFKYYICVNYILNKYFQSFSYIIFSNAALLGIKFQGEQFSFVQQNENSSTNQLSNMTMEQQMDTPNFAVTLEIVYLWLFGSWDEVKNWSYIPIKILAILASFFLIIIMQNIFVALMT